MAVMSAFALNVDLNFPVEDDLAEYDMGMFREQRLLVPLMIFAFYFMGAYRSMLWVAAIAAIAWYFSKPTIGKMEQEMHPNDPNQETY